MLTLKEIRYCLDVWEDMYPEADCELNHENPFQLLVAVILSAQATDNLVNKVTPDLFQKYVTPTDIDQAEIEELEQDIKSIGLYRSKAKNLKQMARTLLTEFDGEVPQTKEELETLAGVGRKTANVVASVAFGEPAIAVDTHVERVSKRLGICRWKDSVLQVEKTLMKKIPREEWSATHHRMIFFGRYHCKAKNPNCEKCPLLSLCREGQKRMKQKKTPLA
ncbi:endonuclease III [Salimicrobium flavidum]|uniref:Endonuclease III n=1 Tax=Salimicrobium flavidum TaxID=570947 RepID=A0A1N7IJF2_9BACI|nr:endonuclease III [Salimicrobium flavidum]SIS37215.1 DNA-(apurinic or apyrimidinic site) lyase /endonuclease III [Salimicrobium flavidum]